MKLYKNAIILIVILGLLTGAYLFVNNNKRPKEGTGGSNEIIRIFDLYTDNMVEMTIENYDGTFVFERATEKVDDKETKYWKLVSPDNLRVSRDTLNSIAINFSSLVANKIVEEEAQDLSIYGLDNPVTVTIKMDDGSVYSIQIGDETPTGSGYYAKEKDSNKVYTISSYTGGKIKVSKKDIREKQLFKEEKDDIKYFSLERNGQQVFSSSKTEEDTWVMTYPIKGNTYYETVVTMVDAVINTSVIDFVEENPSDFSKYGLDNPRYVFEYQSSKGTTRLLLGNEKVKGKEIYAKLENNNEVYTISMDSFGFIDKPLKEIVEVFAYIVNINDVNKIEVEMDGQVTTSVLETNEEDRSKDKFYVNGKDASMEDSSGRQVFRKYYQALIGVTLSEVDPEGDPSGKEAEITFTYHLKKDPGIMKVEFIPKDDIYYYVVRNGEYSGILVNKKKFDEPDGVRDSYRKLMEAIENQGNDQSND
ncbi:MAG TPA: DUF4340 domain-containing protein [Clostridiaceae bacterium]|nr:DUF4340 domain-containing protein [Clostridiaceae bacterium]